MNDSSKQNEHHPGWKATTVNKEEKIIAAQWADLHAVFLAVMEELSSGRSPCVCVFLTHEHWTVGWSCDQMIRKQKDVLLKKCPRGV